VEGKNSQNTNKNSDHLKYWVAYSKIPQIGPIHFKRLADYFIDMETAWKARPNELMKAGIERDLASKIITSRDEVSPDEELEKMKNKGVEAVPITSNNYPKRLKEIYNPPPLLYFRGSLDFLKNNCIAVVGTRKFSPYGKQAVEELTSELARSGITIISGLALGIDSLAHKATLSSKGKTIAVLGSAVNKECVYPSTNRHIANEILESGGAILSEYPVGTMPTKYTFPMRNRIVSGLSLGILVIEAPESSGTLITAKYALDQNRDIFSVPGGIYNNNSSGTNNLIKQGAKIVTCANDILEELNIQMVFKEIEKKITASNNEEGIILDILSKEPTHIDKIKVSSKLNINALSSTLTIMEIKGMVKDMGGKNYIIK
jgi:DNA processing protein